MCAGLAEERGRAALLPRTVKGDASQTLGLRHHRRLTQQKRGVRCDCSRRVNLKMRRNDGMLTIGALLRRRAEAYCALKFAHQECTLLGRHHAVMLSASTAAGRQRRLPHRTRSERGRNHGKQSRHEQQNGEKASHALDLHLRITVRSNVRLSKATATPEARTHARPAPWRCLAACPNIFVPIHRVHSTHARRGRG